MSQEIFASTGATGTIHGTHNGGANSNITILIALEPAGAATPTPTPTPTSPPTPTPTPPAGGIALPAPPTAKHDAGATTSTVTGPTEKKSGDGLSKKMKMETVRHTFR